MENFYDAIIDKIYNITLIEKEKINIHAKLAGPFEDEKTELAVRRLINQRSLIEYVGPKYGY